MAKQPARDNPARNEEVGVIGSDAIKTNATDETRVSGVPVSDLPDGQKQAAFRDADGAVPTGRENDLGAFSGKLDETPDDDAVRADVLPREAFDSEGYKGANLAAKAEFDSVVQFPGYRFIAPGRYRNIYDLDDVYDAEDGTQVPDGKYLIGENYLLPTTRLNREVGRDVKGR